MALTVAERNELFNLLDGAAFPLLSAAQSLDEIDGAIAASEGAVDSWASSKGLDLGDVYDAFQSYIDPWILYLEGSTTEKPGKQGSGPVVLPGVKLMGTPVFALGTVALMSLAFAIGHWYANR